MNNLTPHKSSDLDMQTIIDSYSRKFSNGIIAGQKFQLDKMQLGYNKVTYNEQRISSYSDQEPMVRLHFGIMGDYKFSHKQLNKNFDLIGGHFNLMYSPTFDIEVENKSAVIETLGISFKKSDFINYAQHLNDKTNRFIDQINLNQSCLFNPKWGGITHQMEALFDAIKNCPFQGETLLSFLESRGLELLMLAIENLTRQSITSNLKLSKSDREKIIAARDFLNKEVENFPKLSKVAKAVHLNEFKLKHGFKETFGATLFGYMTERRWHIAKRNLLETQNTIAEISFRLGYATPQHFNNRFKKRFGQTPNNFRKNPKNAIT